MQGRALDELEYFGLDSPSLSSCNFFKRCRDYNSFSSHGSHSNCTFHFIPMDISTRTFL